MGRPKGQTSDKLSKMGKKGNKAHRRDLSGEDPVIRVGLMEEYDQISFALNGKFKITDMQGEDVLESAPEKLMLTVIPDQTTEAKAVFSILTTAFARRDSADALRRKLSQMNHPSRIEEIGEEVSVEGRVIANNLKYRVLVGRYATEKEAERVLEEFKNDFAPRIVRQIVKPASGNIKLFDDNSEFNIDVEVGIRITPLEDNAYTTLYKVREGTGFHWEREVTRNYGGIIEIRLDHRSLIMAVTELTLESYLKGVVPAEMPANYPLEALKAQAIAARSEMISKLGVKHLNDPFDMCGNVHCQAYTGITHVHQRSNEAVDATRGYIILTEGRAAEAMYSSCCGGHTEDKVNVWNPPEAEHLRGGWDSVNGVELGSQYDLTTERGARAWVNASPEVWCNISKLQDAPNILKNAERVFRWKVTYTRHELEEIIIRKTGEDIGNLNDIILLSRGHSGRLMEIEIQGTKKNIRIQRELNIRRVLSNSYLFSACFYIETDFDTAGRPKNFNLIGAGWGHGVGMCQVGAGSMAHSGKNFKEILNHYYPTTKVEKAY